MYKSNSIAVANELITLSDSLYYVDHMKLQKLVYIVYGNWLINHEDACLDENPQVWHYGPIFANMYHQLKHNKVNVITEKAMIYNEFPLVEHPDMKYVIARVWDKFKNLSGPELSNLTNRPSSPWFNVAKRFDFVVPIDTEIDTDDIKRYFRESVLLSVLGT